MITQEYLDNFRCPFDPKREAKLKLDGTKVLCERCGVQFRTREGFVSLVMEEATLPENCDHTNQLPCQRRRQN
jgi:hypothetical protein